MEVQPRSGAANLERRDEVLSGAVLVKGEGVKVGDIFREERV